MNTPQLIRCAFDQGEGILRLAPAWVPRSFCIPGRRIKLHPDDYYALGGPRGGIDERWLSSTTPADNGPLTSANEGLSLVVFEEVGESRQFLLRDAVDELKGALVGERIWEDYGRWPVYSKFFDNMQALPFHIHHRDEHAKLVGQLGKPEAYYFPPQLNNHSGSFPYTFFGLRPETTKDEVRQCLAEFEKGDNTITRLSVAYRLLPGTGWDVPPGVLHAPGSLCTYEPQRASDVFGMFESLTGNSVIPRELLVKDVPADKHDDLDYLIDIVDWELNTDPRFGEHRLMKPSPVRPLADMHADGYEEKWICYKSPDFSAKELTVLPGRSAVIHDRGAYGLIALQGHGTLGKWPLESPAMIRFGQLTHDEYFVSEQVAQSGVRIENASKTDPLVMLKHFGPGNPELYHCSQ